MSSNAHWLDIVEARDKRRPKGPAVKYLRKTTSVVWKVFRTALLVGLCFVVMYPLFYMVSVAFRPTEQLFDPVVIWIPRSLVLDNLKLAFETMQYPKALLTTLRVNLVSSILQVAACAITGYGFARFKFRGRMLLLGMVIFTIIVPPQTLTIPTYLKFKYFDFFGAGRILGLVPGISGTVNLLNTAWTFYLPAIFGTGIRSGLFILIFVQFFRGMPLEIEESAYIDGAGSFRTFLSIIVPNSGPVVLTVFLFSIVWYWNDFYLSAMYFSTHNTVSTALVYLENALAISMDTQIFEVDPYVLVSTLQAGSILAIVPLLIVFIALQKYFTESVERTGIVE
jgi:multiple sugar transport system permease protein